MNYLAHLFLSENHPESQIGSLLADFIRTSNSTLRLHYNQNISTAVILHREIDRFTDAHDDVTSAVRFFFPKFRHYSRIVVDILFDHFLTVHWSDFSGQSLDSFVENVYRLFQNLPVELPEKFQIFASRLVRYDLLRAYMSIDDLREVFSRVDKRFKNPIGLQDAANECFIYYRELDTLFLSFFPQLVSFSQCLELKL
jgi:acyl carrier protein phosphodiesterase